MCVSLTTMMMMKMHLLSDPNTYLTIAYSKTEKRALTNKEPLIRPRKHTHRLRILYSTNRDKFNYQSVVCRYAHGLVQVRCPNCLVHCVYGHPVEVQSNAWLTCDTDLPQMNSPEMLFAEGSCVNPDDSDWRVNQCQWAWYTCLHKKTDLTVKLIYLDKTT